MNRDERVLRVKISNIRKKINKIDDEIIVFNEKLSKLDFKKQKNKIDIISNTIYINTIIRCTLLNDLYKYKRILNFYKIGWFKNSRKFKELLDTLQKEQEMEGVNYEARI